MSQKVYIHYGAKKFDPEKFAKPRNSTFPNKPEGGLWASPVDSTYGWKDWCKQEDYAYCDEEHSFKFVLAPEANVYTIRTEEDYRRFPEIPNDPSPSRASFYIKDFENWELYGIDAVEVEWFADHYNCLDPIWHSIYGWDCDSIVVLNPDVIIPIE